MNDNVRANTHAGNAPSCFAGKGNQLGPGPDRQSKRQADRSFRLGAGLGKSRPTLRPFERAWPPRGMRKKRCNQTLTSQGSSGGETLVSLALEHQFGG